MDEANHRQGDHSVEEPVGWKYTPGGTSASSDSLYNSASEDDATPATHGDGIEWTASEFIAHQKSPTWYLALVVAAIIIGLVVYLVGRDLLSTIIVCLLVVIFAAAGSLKPRVLTYHVGPKALRIGMHVHPYGLFKSFAVINEGAFSNIMLVPLKRFSFPVNVYYPPEEEGRIIEALSAHLPMQPPSDDALDRFIRKVHF